MPALTFKIFFFYFYLSDMLSMLCVVVPVLFTQLFVKLQTLNNIQRELIQSFCLWRLFLRRKGKMWAIAFSNKATFMNKTHPYILN